MKKKKKCFKKVKEAIMNSIGCSFKYPVKVGVEGNLNEHPIHVDQTRKELKGM
jgi:hypothetical protein